MLRPPLPLGCETGRDLDGCMMDVTVIEKFTQNFPASKEERKGTQ
jgi:hypothetical protein